MLIYLASYPRSGNMWVRNLINHYFDRCASSIYREGDEGSNLNLVCNEDGTFGSPFIEYESKIDPSVTRQRLVLGCKPLLNDDFRQQIAAAEEFYFLKTHELPFPHYYEGEYIINIVRHPGAATWSYFNFIKDFSPHLADGLTVSDIIRGNTPGAMPKTSWSEHVEKWLACGESVAPRFLSYSYEQLSITEAEFCQNVSTLLNLDIVNEIGSFPSFNKWRKQDSKLFRQGQCGEWRAKLTADEIALLAHCHGSTMDKLGYRDDAPVPLSQ